MTYYSKNQLRDSVMEEIGVKDSQSELSDADSKTALDEIQRTIEYLEMENVIVFDSQRLGTVKNIPGSVFNGLADIMKFRVAPKFGISLELVAGPRGPESYEDRGMRLLRRATLQGSDDVPTQVTFF